MYVPDLVQLFNDSYQLDADFQSVDLVDVWQVLLDLNVAEALAQSVLDNKLAVAAHTEVQSIDPSEVSPVLEFGESF